MNFKDQIAIVTGGASGIGKATVERLLDAGIAGVVVSDINYKEAQRAAGLLMDKYQSQVIAVETDIGIEKDIHNMVNITMETFSRIDILVSNAGICPVVPWEQTTVENWNHILQVNLTSAFVLTKAVVPIMQEQKHGRIVYISSTAASVGSLVAHVAYGVTKAGLLALMKSVAKGFASEGITANAVSPGTISTPMTDGFGPEIAEAFKQNCVMKRQGRPEEIADVVLCLVSDRTTYVTGQNIFVDGGFALR